VVGDSAQVDDRDLAAWTRTWSWQVGHAVVGDGVMRHCSGRNETRAVETEWRSELWRLGRL
jgi:hypothetical protein